MADRAREKTVTEKFELEINNSVWGLLNISIEVSNKAFPKLTIYKDGEKKLEATIFGDKIKELQKWLKTTHDIIDGDTDFCNHLNP